MKPIYFKILFWIWFSLVFTSSFFSTGWISKINDPANPIRPDYFLHFITFFAFPIIAWYSTRSRAETKHYYILIAACSVLAIAAELVQKFIKERVFNLYDMIANLLGVAVGMLLIYLIKNTYNYYQQSNR